MAEPTVFEMEIEGVVHPIEDRTARQTVGKLTTYSTTEQDTGRTWVDGKPIYRKVVTGAISGATEINVAYAYTMATGITNAESVVSINGLLDVLNGGTYWTLPCITYNDPTSNRYAYAGVNFNVDTGSLGIRYNWPAWNGSRFIVIIEYTKTTD